MKNLSKSKNRGGGGRTSGKQNRKFGGKGGSQKSPRPPRKKKPVHIAVERAAPADNPRAKALAKRISELALDKKALDVVILDVRGMTSYADYFVIASGESERQVSALAEHIEVTLKNEQEVRALGTEGRETGNWVLLDFGEVVVHLFYSEQRAFYDLEGLWADAARETVAG
ncbi:MAG: ribosome silencing factor [Myxococcaceae bacterium]